MADVSLRIEVREPSQAGEARRAAAMLARHLAFGDVDAGRLALVVSEAASNLLKHAVQGEIVLTPNDFEASPTVDVFAVDRGPGMVDISRNLKDGFSTAGSCGTGLGAMTRQADDFDVYSVPGSGTAIWARVQRREGDLGDDSKFEVGAINLPHPAEKVSGDGWAAHDVDGNLSILVVDGLGHGPEAAEAADLALATFSEHREENPALLLELTHDALRHSRGAAGAVAQVRPQERRVVYAGIGNIRGMVLTGAGHHDLASHDGTLGLRAQRIREFVYDWAPNSLLIVMSDGVTGRVQLESYPGLVVRAAPLVSAVLMRDFRRGTDDATVVAVRARGGEHR